MYDKISQNLKHASHFTAEAAVTSHLILILGLKAILYQYYNYIGIESAGRPLKQGILTLTQQGDALCMVHCDIATHGSLFGLLMLNLYN